MSGKSEWFAEWFDSPYYHILYQNHNEQSAKDFIDNLFKKLTPQYPVLHPTSYYKILDLACGKGRHSRYMASKGFDVTGIDLSENSIQYARQFESENLSFFEHDMRKPFRINYFDYIFNIFTSFGYFDKDEDNVTALKCVHDGLKDDGTFILDYFNSTWVRNTMKPSYTETAGDIVFNIEKYIENGHIFKTISFEVVENAVKKHYHFQEKVRLFSLQDFETIFEKADFKIVEKYGDYKLNPFDVQKSNRLIIKAVKKFS
jgi:SAM-dependent methyltransferase